MPDIPHIVSVEPVIQGVLKLTWDDGYDGVVDLRPIIMRGKNLVFLQNPQNFIKVKLGEYGRSIGWVDDKGEKMDFGSLSLRQRAERQTELHFQAG
jgi:hypothetical protein